MQACPFQVPTYEWNKRLPKMRKCDMCYDRQSQGKMTACSEVCPMQATITGDRDALIAEARQRIAAKPDQYYQKIYGLKEVGGTSVLYLSAVPFEQEFPRNRFPKPPGASWNYCPTWSPLGWSCWAASGGSPTAERKSPRKKAAANDG
jgi:formate dehydrogenase iron-sulfur subunit